MKIFKDRAYDEYLGREQQEARDRRRHQGNISLVNSYAAFKTPANEASFHPVPTALFPYPFLCPSQIQTLDLLFVNVGFYSRSAPGWKEGASHAQPWSSSSTSQCWVGVFGRDAERAAVPGKCPHHVGHSDLARHLQIGNGDSDMPSGSQSILGKRAGDGSQPYLAPDSPFKLPC